MLPRSPSSNPTPCSAPSIAKCEVKDLGGSTTLREPRLGSARRISYAITKTAAAACQIRTGHARPSAATIGANAPVRSVIAGQRLWPPPDAAHHQTVCSEETSQLTTPVMRGPSDSSYVRAHVSRDGADHACWLLTRMAARLCCCCSPGIGRSTLIGRDHYYRVYAYCLHFGQGGASTAVESSSVLCR